MKNIFLVIGILLLSFDCIKTQKEYCYDTIARNEFNQACDTYRFMVSVAEILGISNDKETSDFNNTYLYHCIVETMQKAECEEESGVIPTIDSRM